MRGFFHRNLIPDSLSYFDILTAYQCMGLIKYPSFEWVKNSVLKNKKSGYF